MLIDHIVNKFGFFSVLR